DVEAPKDLSNPDAVFTDSFDSSSESKATTEEEIKKNEGIPDVVANSESEKNKKKDVSSDDDESEKTVTEGQTM
ncbi:hypothetical protein A2U01_0104761, partial [Trifolium medium]|nr:hypothetical protein [Trifolium medium]